MTMTNRRKTIAALPLLGVVVLFAACRGARTRDDSAAVKDIELSYKRDPRVIDPYRGLGPWVAGPGYAGATAQDKVEAAARAVDAKGRAVPVKLEWIPSDPKMVTVHP